MDLSPQELLEDLEDILLRPMASTCTGVEAEEEGQLLHVEELAAILRGWRESLKLDQDTFLTVARGADILGEAAVDAGATAGHVREFLPWMLHCVLSSLMSHSLTTEEEDSARDLGLVEEERKRGCLMTGLRDESQLHAVLDSLREEEEEEEDYYHDSMPPHALKSALRGMGIHGSEVLAVMSLLPLNGDGGTSWGTVRHVAWSLIIDVVWAIRATEENRQEIAAVMSLAQEAGILLDVQRMQEASTLDILQTAPIKIAHKLEKLLQERDLNGEGSLSQWHFATALRDVQSGLGLSDGLVRRLFLMQGTTDTQGRIDYGAWVPHAVHAILLHSIQDNSPQDVTEARAAATAAGGLLLAAIANTGALRRGTVESVLDELSAMCRASDLEGKGILSAEVFQSVLKRAGLGLSDAEVNAITAGLESENEEGDVSWESFVYGGWNLMSECLRDMRSCETPEIDRRELDRNAKSRVIELPPHETVALVQHVLRACVAEDGSLAQGGNFSSYMSRLSTDLRLHPSILRKIFLAAGCMGDEMDRSYESFLPVCARVILGHVFPPKEKALSGSTQSSMLPDSIALKEDLSKGLSAAFEDADIDGSGYLDIEEFRSLLQRAGLGLSEPELNAVMAEVDLNGDGLISWSEFIPTAYEILIDVARDMRVRETFRDGGRGFKLHPSLLIPNDKDESMRSTRGPQLAFPQQNRDLNQVRTERALSKGDRIHEGAVQIQAFFRGKLGRKTSILKKSMQDYRIRRSALRSSFPLSERGRAAAALKLQSIQRGKVSRDVADLKRSMESKRVERFMRSKPERERLRQEEAATLIQSRQRGIEARRVHNLKLSLDDAQREKRARSLTKDDAANLVEERRALTKERDVVEDMPEGPAKKAMLVALNARVSMLEAKTRSVESLGRGLSGGNSGPR